MSQINTNEYKCRQCNTPINQDWYRSINVYQNPELKDKVKNGSLFIWDCPKCGTRNLINKPVLYHDPENKLMIWYINNDVDNKQLEIISKELPDYTLRITNDLGSLIEKVNIFDAGLDDMVIEICKWVTKMELIDKIKDNNQAKEILESHFKFYRLNGADNEIILSFPTEDSMKSVNIGLNVYEDCRMILQRNPNLTSQEGFVIIDEYWVKERLR